MVRGTEALAAGGTVKNEAVARTRASRVGRRRMTVSIGLGPFDRRYAPPPMKILVCVKEVPDAAAPKRIDPQTKRLDRGGEGVLNEFDAHALEEGLRLKEGWGEGEVVAVTMGPERAAATLRKALAMGADRAVLVSDGALAGSDLVATGKVLA